MLVLDLRWLLFALLVAAVVAVRLAPWLARRLRRGRAFLDRPDPDHLGAALEHAPFGLLLLDGPAACRYANLQARQLLGLDSAAGPLPPAAWGEALAADRASARAEPAVAGRFRTFPLALDQPCPQEPADPTARFVRWWITPLEDLDLVLLLDVSGQQRAEAATRALLNDLSHELRTPVATILTHLEVLGLASVSPEVRQQSLGLLKAEARRMARLVHQMLELGRLETSADLDRRPLDLLALVEQAVAQVAPAAEEHGIVLTLEAATPLPEVPGDRDRLHQVFLNLLDNAVKYCRPGDRVVVALAPDGDGVRCAVRDTGPGIPARHLPHLTRRFYRAAGEGTEGSGLGLALVEAVLLRHQSRLTIASRTEGPDQGTSFEFVLPTDGVKS